MPTIATTRVRPEWVESVLREFKTVTRLAEKLGVDKSTASRWLNARGEASPRFIGTVLTTFPIDFDDAFIAVVEQAERRRVRFQTHATGIPA